MYRLSLLLVIFLLLGCEPEAPQAAAALEQNTNLQAIADQLEDAFSTQDVDAITAMYSENARLVNELYHREEYNGKEAIKENTQVLFGAFPDATIEITNTVVSGNQLVIEAIFRATNTGALVMPDGEIPPTGKSIEQAYIFVVTVNDEGLIEEDRTYYDSAAFMAVLTPDEESA